MDKREGKEEIFEESLHSPHRSLSFKAVRGGREGAQLPPMVSIVPLALSFLLGAAAVVAAQAVALLYLLRRLRRAGGPTSSDQDPPPETRDLDPEQSIAFAWNKQVRNVPLPPKLPPVV